MEYFSFHKSAIRGKSIFRIFELPTFTIVSNHFVEKVRECGLEGLHFQKIWPFEPGTNWRVEAKREETADVQHLKQNTVILQLALADSEPSQSEATQFEGLQDELDEQLAIRTLDSPYFGRYEGHEVLSHLIRVYISCPEATQLAQKLRPWLRNLKWAGATLLIKRFGPMHDVDAREERVECFGD